MFCFCSGETQTPQLIPMTNLALGCSRVEKSHLFFFHGAGNDLYHKNRLLIH